MTRKIQSIETFLDTVRDRLSLPEQDGAEEPGRNGSLHPKPLSTDDGAPPNSSPVAVGSRTWEVRMDPETGPATIPASVVGEVPSPEIAPSGSTSYDLISKGVVTLEQAQALFDVYAFRLDHYLYRILGESPTLEGIRSSSSLLLAAVCTVGCLHSPQHAALFDRCYSKFIDLAAARTFTKDNNLDDIRALCIGAFWLHDLSWTLIGQGKLNFGLQPSLYLPTSAVRISAQLNLHRTIYKALADDKDAYLKTRLYYLVYVCCHHFSIPYGRPSMARTDESILACQRVLKTKNAGEDDARLVSQVKLWSIATYVLDDFGFDVDRPVSVDLIPNLRRFNIALDTWRADWSESFGINAHVGDYPRKGVSLHYHFAKLYLTSHAFRGAPVSNAHRIYQLSAELEEFAQAAVQSAKAILRTVIQDEEIQSHLNGLSLYFDTMIAFAAVFLLKVATKFAATVRVDSNDILYLVEDLARVLKNVTAKMHRQHLLVCIADGIVDLLRKCKDAGQSEHRQPSVTAVTPQQSNMMIDQNDSISGGFDWTNYDFLLSSQDAMPGFDTWPMNFEFTTS